jgi:hypothetical protein
VQLASRSNLWTMSSGPRSHCPGPELLQFMTRSEIMMWAGAETFFAQASSLLNCLTVECISLCIPVLSYSVSKKNSTRVFQYPDRTLHIMCT